MENRNNRGGMRYRAWADVLQRNQKILKEHG